jgi:preprotein translocase subunit SecG
VLVADVDVPWYSFVLNIVVGLVGIFLILLVLIQRGKGGGLAGAFGGVGGSSPFGSRAGDTFTRITIVVATVWILLTMIQVKVVQRPTEGEQQVNYDLGTGGGGSSGSNPPGGGSK